MYGMVRTAPAAAKTTNSSQVRSSCDYKPSDINKDGNPFQPGQAQAGPSTQRWGPQDTEQSKPSILDANGTLFKMFESAATTVASLVMLGYVSLGHLLFGEGVAANPRL